VLSAVPSGLAADPIFVHGTEAWASEGNVASMRQMLDSDRAEGIKRVIRALLPQMEANRDRFVTITEDQEVRLDTVHPLPRAVALLVGRGCISTCEQFVLDAGQSRKVTVMGTENTGGFLDYGNVRRVPLPSGRRVFQVPTSRSRRLPDHPMDVVGIPPEVRIPEGEADPVEFARRYLRSRGGSP
jgi:C-terminal processing protease CtpA/Prc